MLQLDGAVGANLAHYSATLACQQTSATCSEGVNLGTTLMLQLGRSELIETCERERERERGKRDRGRRQEMEVDREQEERKGG